MTGPGYVELQCASHFSFLQAVSSCEELFERAKALGMPALAIADRNTLAGIVRGHVAAQATGVRLIIGCRLDLKDGLSLLVYPTDRAAYGRLCRLLSLGKRRAGKGKCELEWSDVEDFHEGLIAIYLPDQADALCAQHLRRVKGLFAERAYVSLTLRRRQNDYVRLLDLSNLAQQCRVPTVVTNDVLYATHDRDILHDVVTCIRNRCTIDNLGDARNLYADRYLKAPEEMARLFPDYREALRRTVEIADRCRFSLSELEYQYPEEKQIEGLTAIDALKRETWAGARRRYPEGVPQKVIGLLRHELTLIESLQYAPYFLTVNSIVRFAREQGILCQGRGSAANSCVCYCLGITSIDPERNDLLFERFISAERAEPPDIDVDFEHQRREIIMQWVFETYGRDHAALTSVVVRYRARGAIREVARALGFPEDFIKTLSSAVSAWSRAGFTEEAAAGLNINLNDRRIRLAIELAQQLMNTPRHLSQHPGGFVLTRDRLDELVPIEPAAMAGRQVIEWDKDDIDALRFMKVDCLALGMMSAMKRSLNLLAEHKGIDLDLATIPAEDPRTYAMIRKADTVGVFQIESRAQRSSLPRMLPETFWDLTVQVAIIRPGPIQGDMVHPYWRRRQGLETWTPPSKALEQVLGKTYGVPLFQEQAMRVAIIAAGFSPGDADTLRRKMATFKHTGGVVALKAKLIDGMVGNGYSAEDAETIYNQLEGFGSYGFPESHAASFALIAYASSWMKCHHPDVFCAALLNSQPMGFYAPAQLVRDASEHRVEVRPICINRSHWDCTLEPTQHPNRFAVRLGFRLVKCLRNQDMAELVGARGEEPFASIPELWRRARTPVATLERLAKANVFEPALKQPRRQALFTIKSLRDDVLPLFDGLANEGSTEPVTELKAMTAGANTVEDYNRIGLTLGTHPLSFLRGDFQERGVLSCKQVLAMPNGKWVQTAGIVLTRQMPSAANGVIFMTIEDETSDLNIIIWEKVGQQFHRAVRGSSLAHLTGIVQREGEIVHLIARTVDDWSADLAKIAGRDEAFEPPRNRIDVLRNGGPVRDPREPRGQVAHEPLRIKSRDFR